MITREQILQNEKFWIETIQNKIYNDLAKFVEKEKISQKELARRLNVSKGRISQILNGSNLNFRIETLVKISLAIDKIPNFNLEDIDVFIEKDSDNYYGSNVYKEDYDEVVSAVSSISLSADISKEKGRIIPLEISDKSNLVDDYQNCEISQAV